MIDYSIIIKEEAEIDLIEIYTYYEAKKEGLGLRFINYFEDSIQKIKRNPFHSFNVTDEARRILIKIFLILFIMLYWTIKY